MEEGRTEVTEMETYRLRKDKMDRDKRGQRGTGIQTHEWTEGETDRKKRKIYGQTDRQMKNESTER